MGDWLRDTFGDGGALAVQFVLALIVVLVLLAILAWLLRRVAAGRFGSTAGRNRQPRLAIMDAAPIDTRRRLVLVRRDNVEHLLLIGGPTDVVVEQQIVRGMPVGTPHPRAAARRARPETGEAAAPTAAGAAAAASGGLATPRPPAQRPGQKAKPGGVEPPSKIRQDRREPAAEAGETGAVERNVSERLEEALRQPRGVEPAAIRPGAAGEEPGSAEPTPPKWLQSALRSPRKASTVRQTAGEEARSAGSGGSERRYGTAAGADASSGARDTATGRDATTGRDAAPTSGGSAPRGGQADDTPPGSAAAQGTEAPSRSQPRETETAHERAEAVNPEAAKEEDTTSAAADRDTQAGPERDRTQESRSRERGGENGETTDSLEDEMARLLGEIAGRPKS